MTGAAPDAWLTPADRDHFLAAIRATFARQANDPALVFGGQGDPLTFGALDALACRGAAWLQGVGVAAGDRVALVTAEKRSFLAAHLAALYAGAVALPLNPRFTRDELRYFLADSGAVVAVVGAAQRPIVESLKDELPALRAIVADDRGGGPTASASVLSRPGDGGATPLA